MTAVTFPSISKGFLLDEDEAIRRHLLGLTVDDDRTDSRPVGVWFSHPDNEVREQRYPYIIVSLIDISEGLNRVMSGQGDVQGVPMSLFEKIGMDISIVDGQVYNANGLWNDIWNDKSSFPLRFESHAPTPVQIDYQIRAFSRHPRHSRQILAQLLGKKVPYRYGYLHMEDIDGSVRRMELLDIAHGENIEDGRRLFISAFTVRVDAYMPYGDDVSIIEESYVLKVFGDVSLGVGGIDVGTAANAGWYLEVDAHGVWRRIWRDQQELGWTPPTE